MTRIIYIGIGSNIGDRLDNIKKSVHFVSGLLESSVTRISSLYEGQAREVTEQPDFFNTVIEVSTTLSPESMMHYLLEIESEMGRVRTRNKGPRNIDLDLLIFGEKKIDTPDLTIPHPHMLYRNFVLLPLSELAPDLVIPGTNHTVRHYVKQLSGDDGLRCLGSFSE